jgi:hypothetical protein
LKSFKCLSTASVSTGAAPMYNIKFELIVNVIKIAIQMDKQTGQLNGLYERMVSKTAPI